MYQSYDIPHTEMKKFVAGPAGDVMMISVLYSASYRLKSLHNPHMHECDNYLARNTMKNPHIIFIFFILILAIY